MIKICNRDEKKLIVKWYECPSVHTKSHDRKVSADIRTGRERWQNYRCAKVEHTPIAAMEKKSTGKPKLMKISKMRPRVQRTISIRIGRTRSIRDCKSNIGSTGMKRAQNLPCIARRYILETPGEISYLP